MKVWLWQSTECFLKLSDLGGIPCASCPVEVINLKVFASLSIHTVSWPENQLAVTGPWMWKVGMWPLCCTTFLYMDKTVCTKWQHLHGNGVKREVHAAWKEYVMWGSILNLQYLVRLPVSSQRFDAKILIPQFFHPSRLGILAHTLGHGKLISYAQWICCTHLPQFCFDFKILSTYFSPGRKTVIENSICSFPQSSWQNIKITLGHLFLPGPFGISSTTVYRIVKVFFTIGITYFGAWSQMFARSQRFMQPVNSSWIWQFFSI